MNIETANNTVYNAGMIGCNLNGRSCSLKKILEELKDIKIYIPIYQRNYKWNSSMALKLVQNLIEKFESNDKNQKSLGLVTFYISKGKNECQLIDGQQRMITLFLILKELGSIEYNLFFERDTVLERNVRNEFLNEITSRDELLDADSCFTDLRRFQYNYNGIHKEIENRIKDIKTKDDFKNYILNNTMMLVHITGDEPVSEFLNLNSYKTQFSVCDDVRSKLIIYGTFNPDKLKNDKNLKLALGTNNFKIGVSCLFEELTKLMYCDKVYNIVKEGYPLDPDYANLNRINIMFYNLCDDLFRSEEEKIYSLDEKKTIYKLAYYKEMLRQLKEQSDNDETLAEKSFKNLNKKRKVRFFDLLDSYMDKYSPDGSNVNFLIEILQFEHSIDKIIFKEGMHESRGNEGAFVNSYFNIIENNNQDSSLDFKNTHNEKYFIMSEQKFEDIVHTSGKYLLKEFIFSKDKEKPHKFIFPFWGDFEEQVIEENNKKNYNNKEYTMAITLRELVKGEKIKSIIIPIIQRDYCMANHFKNQKNNLLVYLKDCYLKSEDSDSKSEITLSAITIYIDQTNKKLYLYDGQQRTLTLTMLLRLLSESFEQSDIGVEFEFEGRKLFQNSFNSFIKGNKNENVSYADKAIELLKKEYDTVFKNIDKAKFKTYLLESVRFDIVQLEDDLSSSEQYFIDINGGVALVPYEIFKCKLFDKLKHIYDENEDYKKWLNVVDNILLDKLYLAYGNSLDNEETVEELALMRFIEFCFYFYCINKKGIDTLEKIPRLFGDKSGLGDVDELLQIDENISRNVYNVLIKRLGETSFQLDDIPEVLIKRARLLYQKDYLEKDCYKIPFYNEEFDEFTLERYLQNFFRKNYIKDERYNLDRQSDIVFGNLICISKKQASEIAKKWNKYKYKGAFAYLRADYVAAYDYAPPRVPRYYTKSLNNNSRNMLEKIIYVGYDEHKMLDVLKKMLSKNDDKNEPAKLYDIYYYYHIAEFSKMGVKAIPFYDKGLEEMCRIGIMNDKGHYSGVIKDNYRFFKIGNWFNENKCSFYSIQEVTNEVKYPDSVEFV